MKKNSVLISIFMVFAFFAAAFGDENTDLLKRIDEKLMPESYEAYRKLINIEPNGNKKEFVFYSVKKGKDKMAMLYLLPASEKGRTTLRLGDNMWLYIPSVGKPIRITSLQSITGGVFNNSDIMQLDYSAEYDVAKVEKDKDGYTLELKAKNKSVAYDRLIMRASLDEILKKIECFSATGMLIKTLEFKEIKEFKEGFARPSVIETFSPLYKGYKSIMIYSKINARDFSDEVFTMNYMSKIGGLRQ